MTGVGEKSGRGSRRLLSRGERELWTDVTRAIKPLGLNETDEAFCRRLVAEHRVAAIPVSSLYEDDPVTSVIRFCFAKRDATIDEALQRLSHALR